MRRATKILSLAALTAVSAYGKSTMAASETWTGAVNNSWDANATSFTATPNWSSGGSPVLYNVGDDVFFTDNFTGPTGIDVGTLSATTGTPNSTGMNPTSMTFTHIAGSTPTTYTFNRFKSNNLNAGGASTPFGLSANTVLTLDTGFLGKVILQNRALNTGAGTIVTANTIVRSGILELQDAGALPNGLNSSGTLSNNSPRITLDGGQLNIAAVTYTASPDGITPPTFVYAPPSSTQLTGTLTVLSNSTLAYGEGVDGRFYNGTISIASNATLKVTSLTGFQGQFSGSNGSGSANGDFSQSTGTVLFENTGSLANAFRFENARASGINATFDLGTGSSTIASNFANDAATGSGTLTLGALMGGANTKIYGSSHQVIGVGSAAALQLTDTYQIGTKNLSTQYDGTLNDGTATVIAGPGGAANRRLAITKNGSGVLTLTGLNTYTGSTNVAGGTLSVASIANSGVNSNIGAGTQIFVTGGALKHTGAAAASTDRLLNINASGGTIDSSGGGLNFTGAVADNDAASRGGTIQPGSNILSFSIVGNQATGNILGQGNTSDLVVGMSVTNTTAFPAGPVTITAVGLGTVTLSGAADAAGTLSNATVAFGPADRTLNLTGSSTGSVAGAIADSAKGGKLTLLKSGTGAWTLNGANTSAGGVTATGGTLNFGNASNLSSGAISANGGSIVLAAGHTTAEKITSLSIGATNSALDVTDNDLVITSATPKTTVEGYVRNARDAGQWDKAGLTTSTARPVSAALKPTGLGVISGAEYTSVGGSTTFNGVGISASDTLVKYTWNGDADFSGRITADDYGHIDGGYQNQNGAGFVFDWFNGDFDYSGRIDANDYALIDSAYQQQSGTLRAALAAMETGVMPTGDLPDSLQQVVDHYGEFGKAYASAFVNISVPEPTTLSVIGLAAAGIVGRRRRAR